MQIANEISILSAVLLVASCVWILLNYPLDLSFLPVASTTGVFIVIFVVLVVFESFLVIFNGIIKENYLSPRLLLLLSHAILVLIGGWWYYPHIQDVLRDNALLVTDEVAKWYALQISSILLLACIGGVCSVSCMVLNTVCTSARRIILGK